MYLKNETNKILNWCNCAYWRCQKKYVMKIKDVFLKCKVFFKKLGAAPTSFSYFCKFSTFCVFKFRFASSRLLPKKSVFF
jgi:hypothetical protein